MDITEVIQSQHQDQRRMFALLDEIGRCDVEKLGPVWSRLRSLLEVHAEAEEKFFYPRLLSIGQSASGAGSAAGEAEDAVKDHNQIRDAIAAAREFPIGDSDWWNAVTAARTANSDHMAEEEREGLAEFRRYASLQDRHDAAVHFLAYEAANAGDRSSHDKDPKQYVQRRSNSAV